MNARSWLAALMLCASALQAPIARADEARSDSSITILQTLKSASEKGLVSMTIPAKFDPNLPPTIVVYFHGILTNETFSDVLKRQRVGEQVAEANVNAVLVAPALSAVVNVEKRGRGKKKGRGKKRMMAFAKDAFIGKDTFKTFLREAGGVMAASLRVSPTVFTNARIVLVAYSGGHVPARVVITRGNVVLDGVLLLDAHYGSQEAFAQQAVHTAKRRSGFFVSSYTNATAKRAEEFEGEVTEAKTPTLKEFPDGRLPPGTIVVRKIEGKNLHYDFVNKAWVENPITDILKRAYAQQDAP